MEKYLNDTLTTESKLKAENLSNVDLMPAAIKNWYVRNNKTEMLTPFEYNNDELADVWDMEMLSEIAPAKPSKDTIKKTDSLPSPAPSKPAPSPKVNKETIIDPLQKKKKATKKQNGKL
jgi:hypothetical protein